MKPLILAPTEDTPKIVLDTTADEFVLSSRSLPENAVAFYQPILDWFNFYSKHPNELTKVVFHFDFMSTSSVKQVMKIMFVLDELSKTKKVTVIWSYDKGDSHMKHTGTLLEKLVTFKFTFIEV